ncbi:MAG TPA: S41 family peptidase [Pyrinomonadaceae bacterium]|nr:S41 family peptidase [Pyrinomonadaceae bacterium]
MSSKTFGRVVAVTLLVAATLLGGMAGKSRALRSLSAGTSNGALQGVEEAYDEALSTVAESYADEIDFEKASQAAIQGMLSSLDPHSNYFTKAEYEKLLQDQDSRFIGIGVSILRHRDGVYVQSPVEGTPAARAGLRFGDRIVEVDGKDVREWTTQQVSKAVRGERGQRVKLTIERAGEAAPQYFNITRDSVPQPSIRSAYMIRPGTGYVALVGGFTNTTSQELRDALADLEQKGMNQVVLDLRNNSGGILEQSISVASLFLRRGLSIVSVRGRDGQPAREYKNNGTDPVDFPLVVLINRNSASASEIVAGAIQDQGRGLIVGETSFGKALVQRVFPLPYGAGLTLTTAHYYTPYGRLIQRQYTSGSFYDYYVRHEEQEAPQPAQPASPSQPATPVGAARSLPTPQPTPQPTPSGTPVQTAGGRVFYGGGGITPDYVVKPLDITTPTRLRVFEASFYFVRELIGGQVAGLENYRIEGGPQFGRYPRPTDLPVNERVLEAFRTYVRQHPESSLTPAQVEAELDYVRLRLRDDIVTAAYGAEAGSRVLLDADPQMLRALELLPEARSLAETVGHISRT